MENMVAQIEGSIYTSLHVQLCTQQVRTCVVQGRLLFSFSSHFVTLKVKQFIKINARTPTPLIFLYFHLGTPCNLSTTLFALYKNMLCIYNSFLHAAKQINSVCDKISSVQLSLYHVHIPCPSTHLVLFSFDPVITEAVAKFLSAANPTPLYFGSSCQTNQLTNMWLPPLPANLSTSS